MRQRHVDRDLWADRVYAVGSFLCALVGGCVVWVLLHLVYLR